MRFAAIPKLFCLLIISSLCAAPLAARAETLDEASIRALYARLESDIRDKSKIASYMQERLVDGYSLSLSQGTIVNGMPPQRSQATLNRADTIAHALKGYESMTVEAAKFEIFDIRYSSDRKVAYVRLTATSSGMLMVSGGTVGIGSAMPSTRYQDVEKCQESLTLESGTIKFLQTACDSQLTVGQ